MKKTEYKKHNLLEAFPKIPYIIFVLNLRYILRDCETVLDLGCGENSPLRFINKETVGIDIYKQTLAAAKNKKTHKRFRLMNVKKISLFFKPGSFDAVVALDLIEHLSKKEGKKLISDMERIARKKVIIFTPNGFSPQDFKESKYEKHLSGWDNNDFKNISFKTFGVFGAKGIRGSNHKIRYSPEFLWGFLSELTNWTFSRWFPNKSTALLAVKKIPKSIT